MFPDVVMGPKENNIIEGAVRVGRNDVEYKYSQPEHVVHPNVFVMDSGLASNIDSLHIPFERFAELGCSVIAVGHNHHDILHPISTNAHEVEAVIEEVIPDKTVDLVGLSRGWPAQVLVAQHIEKVNSLTAVAPAMMTPISLSRLGLLGVEVARETFRNPRKFGKVILGSVGTVLRRPDVTISEAVTLTRGFVHNRVSDLKLLKSDIELHLVASLYDGFFDPVGLESIARDLGFDSITLFGENLAGHAALTYNNHIVDEIVSKVYPERAVLAA